MCFRLQVSITWITEDPRDDSESCAQVAAVTLRPQANDLQIAGACLRYSFGAAPDVFGNYTSGRIHRVQVKGLLANSEYTYTSYGDPPNIVRSFKTLPASKPTGSKDARYPFVVGVVGDLGQTEDSTETVRHLDADKDIQIILHAGDMSYADTNAVRWDSYGLKVEPLASRLQWMVCPGNHEIESDYYTGQNFQPYEARFAMPAVQKAEFSPSVEQIGCKHPFPVTPHSGRDCTPSAFTGHYDWGNSFYAFDAGPARVISLNSHLLQIYADLQLFTLGSSLSQHCHLIYIPSIYVYNLRIYLIIVTTVVCQYNIIIIIIHYRIVFSCHVMGTTV